MGSAYAKKYEEMVKHKDQKEVAFEDIVYADFEKRHNIKKMIKQKCEEFLLGLKELSRTDQAADDFKKFMGFDDEVRYPKEVLNLYVQQMNSTGQSFSTLLTA